MDVITVGLDVNCSLYPWLDAQIIDIVGSHRCTVPRKMLEYQSRYGRSQMQGGKSWILPKEINEKGSSGKIT